MAFPVLMKKLPAHPKAKTEIVMIGFKELLVIGVIIILVFGTSKLKNIGGDLGNAIKSFKKAVKDGDDAEKTDVATQKDDDSTKKS